MTMFTGRSFGPELMDHPDVPREELAEAMRFIRFVNARLGGSGAAIWALSRWTARWPADRPLRVIDLGAGVADIPLAIARWAERRGRQVRIVAVDSHPQAVALARELTAGDARLEVVEADARRILERFEPGDFDVAHAGMFLHHLPDIEVVTVLRIMHRLARAGIVWNDLTRDAVSRAGVRLLTLRAPPIVRHDAIASVAKGFTRAEALDLARRAGLENVRWRRHLWGRFTLTAGER